MVYAALSKPPRSHSRAEGNYTDYESDRRRRLGAEALQPHRIRYKPLVRA